MSANRVVFVGEQALAAMLGELTALRIFAGQVMERTDGLSADELIELATASGLAEWRARGHDVGLAYTAVGAGCVNAAIERNLASLN